MRPSCTGIISGIHKLRDDLAAQYSLHPLHIEVAGKARSGAGLQTIELYLFTSLKYLNMESIRPHQRRRSGPVRRRRLSRNGKARANNAARTLA